MVVRGSVPDLALEFSLNIGGETTTHTKQTAQTKKRESRSSATKSKRHSLCKKKTVDHGLAEMKQQDRYSPPLSLPPLHPRQSSQEEKQQTPTQLMC